MNNIDLENSGMTIMYLATSLCEKYDDWKNDENFATVADLNTNSICLGLKNMYPKISDRVRQSMALAFSLYFYLLIHNGLIEADKQIEENQEMMTFADLTVD